MVRFTSVWGAFILCLLATTGRSTSPVQSQQTPDLLANCWQDLAAEDAGQAYRAIWLLAQDPARAVKLLGERLTPAAAPDVEKIQGWLTDLVNPKFLVRDKAFKELEKQGELAEPQLREALKGKADLETRQRVESLLARMYGTVSDAEKLRHIRAVEALEMVGTDDAKKLLQELAKGFPRHRLTQEAQETLNRLRDRAALSGDQPALKLFPVKNSDGPMPFGAHVRLGCLVRISPETWSNPL